jgi:hypothetical protein
MRWEKTDGVHTVSVRLPVLRKAGLVKVDKKYVCNIVFTHVNLELLQGTVQVHQWKRSE